jgi:hypothetical protein
VTVGNPQTRGDTERLEGSTSGIPASIWNSVRAYFPTQRPTRERIVRWLLPADSGGAGEIRALDGVRAIAALSIVVRSG